MQNTIRNNCSPLKLLTVTALSFLALCSCNKQDAITKSSTANISNELNANSPDVQSSLVAWYTFNGNTLDSSTYHNDVIFNNATPAPDRFGNANGAYAFDGSSNYMQVANSSSLNPKGKITLFAIVKVNGFYDGTCHGNRIINKGFNDYSTGGYYLHFDDGYTWNYNQCYERVRRNYENFGAAYGNGQGATSGGVDTLDNIIIGKWYDIAFTYDGDTAKLYVNGDLKSTRIGAYPFTPNTDDLFIGMSNINNTQYPYWFNGVIDEIRIYAKALDEEQINKLHHYTKQP